MTGTETDPQPPRFPYVAALLCAACVGMAGWTWMRYSYAWGVTVDYLSAGAPQAREGRCPDGLFVRFPGIVTYREHGVPVRFPDGGWEFEACAPGDLIAWVTVRTHAEAPPAAGGELVFRGRVSAYEYPTPLPGGTHNPPLPPSRIVTYVNTTASRFTGATIAGLVVGAMGVFVFAAALRHWLERRRMLD